MERIGCIIGGGWSGCRRRVFQRARVPRCVGVSLPHFEVGFSLYAAVGDL